MNDTSVESGRELVMAGRLTQERGHVDITDIELVNMLREQLIEAETLLQGVVRMNPRLVFTTSRDLLNSTTRIEWEPRDPSTAVELPHSRACGILPHAHGNACHSNCRSCGGRIVRGND